MVQEVQDWQEQDHCDAWDEWHDAGVVGEWRIDWRSVIVKSRLMKCTGLLVVDSPNSTEIIEGLLPFEDSLVVRRAPALSRIAPQLQLQLLTQRGNLDASHAALRRNENGSEVELKHSVTRKRCCTLPNSNYSLRAGVDMQMAIRPPLASLIV